jgi:hypothetical protein
MPSPRPNLTAAYVCATASAFCGAAVVILLARQTEMAMLTKLMIVASVLGTVTGLIAAVAAAVAAVKASFRPPPQSSDLLEIREQVAFIVQMMREREPSDEDVADMQSLRERFTTLTQSIAGNQQAIGQTQEMLHQAMSKIDALRSIATTPSPAADALDREADDTDVFPAVQSEEEQPAFDPHPGLEQDVPISRTVSPVFRASSPTEINVEHFDTLDLARARVDDLMALSNWELALAIATTFANEHPEDSDAQWLRQRVAREFEIYREGSVRRLYDQIKEELERKKYRRAMSIARRLLEKFPEHKKADKIRRQLPTILENAEIEERQEEEARIQSFIKTKRFADAVELGEALLAKYPMSPQASSLEEMLPRLRELAIEQEADALGQR